MHSIIEKQKRRKKKKFVKNMKYAHTCYFMSLLPFIFMGRMRKLFFPHCLSTEFYHLSGYKSNYRKCTYFNLEKIDIICHLPCAITNENWEMGEIHVSGIKREQKKTTKMTVPLDPFWKIHVEMRNKNEKSFLIFEIHDGLLFFHLFFSLFCIAQYRYRPSYRMEWIQIFISTVSWSCVFVCVRPRYAWFHRMITYTNWNGNEIGTEYDFNEKIIISAPPPQKPPKSARTCNSEQKGRNEKKKNEEE